MTSIWHETPMTYRDETLAHLLSLCPAADARSLLSGACFGVMALHSAWSQPVWATDLNRLDDAVRRADADGAIQLVLTHDVQLVAAATAALELHQGTACLLLNHISSPRPLDPVALRRLFRAAGCRHAARLAWIDPHTREVRFARARSDRCGTERGSVDHVLLASTNLGELCGDDRFSPQACIDVLRGWRDLGEFVRLLGRGVDTASPTSPARRHYETVGSAARRLSLGQAALLRDETGKPYAALCWSWVSARSVDRLSRQPLRPTSFYEMNDGRICLLEAATFEDDCDLARLHALRPPGLAEADIALHRDGGSLHSFRWDDPAACLHALRAVRRDPTAPAR